MAKMYIVTLSKEERSQLQNMISTVSRRLESSVMPEFYSWRTRPRQDAPIKKSSMLSESVSERWNVFESDSSKRDSRPH